MHINKTKYLYFFGLLSVRLELIKLCLEDILTIQATYNSCFIIKEICDKKARRTICTKYKISVLKEIYYRCWLIQEHALQLSGLFLLIYFIGYIGMLSYVIFYYIRMSILADKFFENLFEIILYFMTLNLFTICFFITSHKIHSKSLKISGLIHQVAHNSVNDPELVKLIKLFSCQILQQPMSHVNIFYIFYYDRSNINGVSLKMPGNFNIFPV